MSIFSVLDGEPLKHAEHAHIFSEIKTTRLLLCRVQQDDSEAMFARA
ncbi:hypothetical protein [Ktedonosporobacter rubrisoli]|nr:hypothetical protein [Ktedonosporobacter rubrisoli]